MATTQKGQAPKVDGKKEGTGVPEGFTPVSTMGSGSWFKPESGGTVWGELLARHRRKKSLNDKEAWFYQIMLEKPCVAQRKVEDESVEVNLQPGEIINVDERSALEELALLMESGKRWRVYIHPINKVPIAGTAQTVWRFAVGKQEIVSGKNEPKVKPIDTPF
jgi:hypothetical protein